MPSTKRCTSCKIEKAGSEFYANKKSKDGLMSHCVACRRARYVDSGKTKVYNRRGYLKHRDRRLAQCAEYRSRPGRAERNREYQKQWYSANRDERKAKSRAHREANLDKIKAHLLATREDRLARRRARRPTKREHEAAYAKAYRARNRPQLLDYMREYNAAHRDRLNKMKKAYREANRDTISEKWSAWYEANRERTVARKRAYQKANPHKLLAHGARRRARIEAATVQDFTLADLRQRIAVFGGRCAYCGGPHEHMDHVKPIAKGGLHCLANLRPSCARCNQKKNAKDPKRWLAKLPRPLPMPLP